MLLSVLGDELGQGHAVRWAELSQEAWDIAERLGENDTILAVYLNCASGIRLPDLSEERQAWDRRVRPLLAMSSDVSTRVLCLNNCLENLADILDWPGFEQTLAEMQELADMIGLDLYRWEPTNFAAWAALTRGRLVESERLRDAALQAGLNANIPPAFASYGAQLMVHRLFTGQLNDLLDAATLAEPPLPSVAVGWRLAIVWMYCQAGRLEEAADRFATSPLVPAELPLDSVWLQSMALLGDCSVYLGRPDLAAACYEDLEPYADLFWFSGSHDIGYLARYLGRMAACLDRYDDAVRHLRYALRMHAEKGLPYWEARSALDLAAVVPGEAVELEARAAALVSTHGFGGFG